MAIIAVRIAVPREHDFPRIRFRGCSYFFMFRPPRLLAPQIVPTAATASESAGAVTLHLQRARTSSIPTGETNAQAPGTAPERFIALTFDDVHLLTSDVAPMRAAANGFIDCWARRRPHNIGSSAPGFHQQQRTFETSTLETDVPRGLAKHR
jgi:hypothetical protein